MFRFDNVEKVLTTSLGNTCKESAVECCPSSLFLVSLPIGDRVSAALRSFTATCTYKRG